MLEFDFVQSISGDAWCTLIGCLLGLITHLRVQILHDLIGAAGIEVEANEDFKDSSELLIAFFAFSNDVLPLDGIEVHPVQRHKGIICERSRSLIDRILKSTVLSDEINLTVVNLSEDNNVFNVVSAELLKLCSISRIKVSCFIFVKWPVGEQRGLMGERLLGLGIDPMARDHCVVDVWAERNLVEGGEKAEIEKGVVNNDPSAFHFFNEFSKKDNANVKIAAVVIDRNRINWGLTAGNSEAGERVGFGMGLDVEEDWSVGVEDSTGFFCAGADDGVGLRLNFF